MFMLMLHTYCIGIQSNYFLTFASAFADYKFVFLNKVWFSLSFDLRPFNAIYSAFKSFSLSYTSFCLHNYHFNSD